MKDGNTMIDNFLTPEKLLSDLHLTDDQLDPQRLLPMDDDTLIETHRKLSDIVPRMTEELRLLTASIEQAEKEKKNLAAEKKTLISAIDALRHLANIHCSAPETGEEDGK